jgi:hypothetical protein
MEEIPFFLVVDVFPKSIDPIRNHQPHLPAAPVDIFAMVGIGCA